MPTKIGAGGCEQYRKLFEQYDWPVETALAICQLESGGVETASNWKDSHDGCNGSFGLMQIGCVHGVSREELYDPTVNVKTAFVLWRDSGFHPWSTYKKLLAYNQ